MFNIVGIDPGNHTGIAIISIDEHKLHILNVKCFTINLDKLITTDENNYYLKRKLELNRVLVDIYQNYGIGVVGLEVPFVNPKFPKSAITLSDYISSIEIQLYNLNPNIKLYKFPPKSVKALVGATGDATKDDMLSNIMKIKELRPYLTGLELTEHSVDALSIGYITLEDIRNNPYYLYSL